MNDPCEESKLWRTARDDVRTRRVSEMRSDPDPCSRMMLRTISPVQSQAVTGTEINQVSVIRSWKATQYKHLRKEATF